MRFELIRAIAQLMQERNLPLWHFPYFVVKYFFKLYVLVLCSEIAPPGITELFHKLRGVTIGKDVFIDRHARIDAAYPEKVYIGDEVRITSGACVMAHIKAGKYLRENYYPSVVREVRIEKYAFIGLNAVIMPGVNVGEGAIVVSNSVVIQDVKPYTVVSGNPAKVISRLKKKQEEKHGQ
jgi:acetyltransferase-like isoleucine patch superfamily enzyme